MVPKAEQEDSGSQVVDLRGSREVCSLGHREAPGASPGRGGASSQAHWENKEKEWKRAIRRKELRTE